MIGVAAQPVAVQPVAAQPVGVPAEAIAPPPVSKPEPASEASPLRTLGEAEIEMIREALAAANGNISEASKRLGISRNTIYRKLRWSKLG